MNLPFPSQLLDYSYLSCCLKDSPSLMEQILEGRGTAEWREMSKNHTPASFCQQKPLLDQGTHYISRCHNGIQPRVAHITALKYIETLGFFYLAAFHFDFTNPSTHVTYDVFPLHLVLALPIIKMSEWDRSPLFLFAEISLHLSPTPFTASSCFKMNEILTYLQGAEF